MPTVHFTPIKMKIAALPSLCFFMLFTLLVSVSCPVEGQSKVKKGKPVPEAFCIRETDNQLFELINNYREKNGLHPVPLSSSLSFVASLHVRDLSLNYHENYDCNLHSWSGKGFWTPFCYPKDENKKQSVWDKPSELTLYPAKGYEIVYWENSDLTPDSVFAVWTSEEFYKNYLLNKGKWEGQEWKAVGVAILGNYACAWFGNETDPEGTPLLCGRAKPIPKKDSVVPQPLNDKGLWYVIVKTNIPEKKAAKELDSLRANGYPEACIIQKDGKIRIAAYGPSDKTTAGQKLREIKKSFKDAWLYKIN